MGLSLQLTGDDEGRRGGFGEENYSLLNWINKCRLKAGYLLLFLVPLLCFCFVLFSVVLSIGKWLCARRPNSPQEIRA